MLQCGIVSYSINTRAVSYYFCAHQCLMINHSFLVQAYNLNCMKIVVKGFESMYIFQK